MKKSTRKTLNRILHQVFKVVTNKHKRARITTKVSKLFVDKNNSVEYDEDFNMYWQLHKGKCLQIHEKPVFDFSYDKYNDRIDAMFCRLYDDSPPNKKRKITMIQIMRNEALKTFELWDKKTDKVKY